MDFPNVGKELAAAGLGFDCCGAIYLGLSLLRSPTYAASVLFNDDVHPGLRGKVSTLPVDEIAMSMLQARVGVLLLLLGFLTQLIGSALPESPVHLGLVIFVTAVAVLISRYIGNRWIEQHFCRLRDAIWASPRETSLTDREAMRRRPSTGPMWEEPRWVVWLRVRFQPSDYRRG